MELVSRSGCICSSLTVDGIEEIDIPFDRNRRLVLFKIGDYVSKQTLDDIALEDLRDHVRVYLDLEEDDVKGKTLAELGELIKNQPPRMLNYVLQFIIPAFGTLTYVSEPCECCGDIVYEYALSL